MNWLELADVTLNSGRRSTFKIECDSITDDEWEAVAALLVQIVPMFSEVVGIPRGGITLAHYLQQHEVELAGTTLIADDVFTTGGSMERTKAELIRCGHDPGRIHGAVLFARGPCPPWVTALFTIDQRLWDQ